tara:strand:+ start:2602 stop:2889 length:288 start_codon:yes stop_codon:yes gene_type:complete
MAKTTEFKIYKKELKYIKPLMYKERLFLTRAVLMSLDKFREEINKQFDNLYGEFLLKDVKGKPFVRFTVSNGKMVKIYKTSPVTGKLYPIWRRMC